MIDLKINKLSSRLIIQSINLFNVQVSAPELVSGVSGDSESKIRDLFKQAEESAPCVLFIDEIDSITPKASYFVSVIKKLKTDV